MSASDAAKLHGLLNRLGVSRDGVVLVHSAFRALGRGGHDPRRVLDALIGYMAPGTLLLPTMSWRFVTRDNPVFDVRSTPSNTGVLTEIFRREVATARSLHPTHSVAGIGPGAEGILGSHQACVTPCAPRSPFAGLRERGGQVLMFGIGMDCCTNIHHAEEEMAPDIYLVDETDTRHYTCVDGDGKEHPVAVRGHRRLARDYWSLQDSLAADGKLAAGRFDNADVLCFSAADLHEHATRLLAGRADAIIAGPGQRYRVM